MRLLVLTANETRQTYFVERLSREHEIVGIVVEQQYSPGDRVRRLWSGSDRNAGVFALNMVRKLRLLTDEMEERRTHERFFGKVMPRDIPGCSLFLTENINTPATLAYVRARSPDLVVVFGTRLLKEPLIHAAKRGAVNIHTGLSPYYRGGHSTFFCLYNNEPRYVGATVHYVDPGIDSGLILRTGRPEIEAEDTLFTLECKVIVRGTELMLDSLRRIECGNAEGVRQWTRGKLYLSRDYTLQRRIELRARMRAGLLRECMRPVARNGADSVRLVS